MTYIVRIEDFCLFFIRLYLGLRRGGQRRIRRQNGIVPETGRGQNDEYATRDGRQRRRGGHNVAGKRPRARRLQGPARV